jgi:hypothetical protein
VVIRCRNGVLKVTKVGLSGLWKGGDADARELRRWWVMNECRMVEGQASVFPCGLQGVDVGE